MGYLYVTSNKNVTMKRALSDPPICDTNLTAIRDSLEILGGKWKLQILHYLMNRESEDNTFKKMEKDLNGISARILSKELKELEINRTVNEHKKPITVSYSITNHGKSTQEIIELLVKWGINHRSVIF